MKKKPRKIIVRRRVFLWRFHAVWQSDHYLSSLTIISGKNRKNGIIIRFITHDTLTAGNPLNEGLPVIRGGQRLSINLNSPGCVAEIIAFLLDDDTIREEADQFIMENGNELLRKMGYREEKETFLVSAPEYTTA